MWVCEKCGEVLEDQFDSCWKCASTEEAGDPGATSTEAEATVDLDPRAAERPRIEFSTGPYLPGRRLIETVGVVFGDALVPANITAGLAAGIAGIVSGRAEARGRGLVNARDVALCELAAAAAEAGGDAVINVRFDYPGIGDGVLLVTASGTAVVCETDE